MRCADCGKPLIWHPARFAWTHKVRPEDDHAPRPVKDSGGNSCSLECDACEQAQYVGTTVSRLFPGGLRW